MKNNHLYLLLSLLCTCSFFGIANELSNEKIGLGQKLLISVEQAYIRSSIPGTTITSSYMIIENKGEKTVTLLGANSKISSRIEIHQHSMSDGMMRMRQLDSIDIKAKQRIVLQPSGLHLMLFNVKKPLQAQQKVELTLNFSNSPPVTIQVPVYSPLQEKRAQEATANSAVKHSHHH
ncbi:copper chaperone PCu(A)C [Candidatus Colwellia aromaticivorans]|uniref:copper chaperone PCu(A)C n=1 Tax=Candidatus Colwellia aromaticivorans TaxID=2267621 RepID=UPI000DF1F289|nr:copper chaperone PCu(A)C [Candidatus Colwellia aromaticivorans]